MNLTRRSLLTGTGLLGLAGVLTACGNSGSTGHRSSVAQARTLNFWYWSGGLSDGAVKDVTASFAGRADVRPTLISGDFKQQLMTALASHQTALDITGVKGEDMSLFLTQPEHFLDLNTLGARSIAPAFAGAKYAQATTADGRQIGLPIDLGPTALFYRADVWAKAGLPVTPATVGARMNTWDGWFESALRLKKARPGTFAIRNSSDVFAVSLCQQPETFVSRSGDFVGDGGGVKVAWDLAVRSITDGVQAGIYDDAAFGAALSAGILAGHLGPAWNADDLETGAPHTAGSWRVAAAPGGPGNIGGSYLTLTADCRNPPLAFAYISALLSPASEAKGFTDASLFPAVTAAYTLPALTDGQSFFGGQKTIDVFGAAAKNLPTVYDSPLNAAVSGPYNTELSNVEGGKNPAVAWKDAVNAGRAIARSPSAVS